MVAFSYTTVEACRFRRYFSTRIYGR